MLPLLRTHRCVSVCHYTLSTNHRLLYSELRKTACRLDSSTVTTQQLYFKSPSMVTMWNGFKPVPNDLVNMAKGSYGC